MHEYCSIFYAYDTLTVLQRRAKKRQLYYISRVIKRSEILIRAAKQTFRNIYLVAMASHLFNIRE